jgi:glycosyltransferase involved in cell wall biosynthesis
MSFSQPEMYSRPLKLALVTRRYSPLIGGAEKVFSYLARAIASTGADVTVITSQPPGTRFPRLEEVPLKKAEIARPSSTTEPGRLKVVRLATARLRFWGTWRYMRNLSRWFDQNPVDLAYVSMLKHDAYVVVRAGGRLNFPVVLRPEGAGATGDVAWQSRGNFGRLIGQTCRHADAIVAISKSVEQELEQALSSGTMRPSRRDRNTAALPRTPQIISIANGVPVPELPWQVRPSWQAAPCAVFIGRLAPEKGLDTLIKAWPRVRQHFPAARVVLIGDGPERAALIDLVKELGFFMGPGQSVDLPGAVADSTGTLRNSDLFVLPSREEGMSIALLEAMALGMPIVATSIPGNQRLITDLEHGRLVAPDDPECFARAIVEQWRNLDAGATMGRAARSRVERDFSIETVARQHLRLFHELLGRH